MRPPTMPDLHCFSLPCTACRDKTLVISVPSLTDLSARTTPDMANPLVVRLR